MPTPLDVKDTELIAYSGENYIDSLLGEKKWASDVNSIVLYYSFPYQNGQKSYFYGYNGDPYYGYETESVQTFGLNTMQIGAAEAALQAWGNVANISFVKVIDSIDSAGDIRFAFFYDENNEGGALYWGHSYYPSSYSPRAGDVWIDSQIATRNNWEKGSFQFEALMHEIGHVLGLKHPFQTESFNGTILSSDQDNIKNTVMSYTDYASFRAHTPMVYDIAAIQHIYGPNFNYRNGDDIYNFYSDNLFLHTIWDGGGIDTISIETLSNNTFINLTPGSYSSFNIETNIDNFGIAFNCIIENVIGGFGDDEIKGNSEANSLSGNLGNDTIFGLGGDDILKGDGGDDVLHGGSGNDKAVYNGNFSEYVILDNGDNIVISDTIFGRDGIDTLSKIEILVFNDKNYQLNIVDDIEHDFEFNMIGTASNDTLFNTNSDDKVNGLGGFDTFYVNRSIYDDYFIRKVGSIHYIEDLNKERDGGNGGWDTLVNVEKVKFLDISLRYDISYSDQSQLVYRLYQAAFARMPDEAGFVYWEGLKDNLTPYQFAEEFRIAPEFTTAYGANLTNNAYTEILYRNVLQRDPDPAGLAFWQGELNNNVLDRTQLLVAFADCPENKTLTQPHIEFGYWLT